EGGRSPTGGRNPRDDRLWAVTERRVRPLLVVETAVHRQFHLSVGQIEKHLDVQHFGAQTRDEALRVTVLPGTAGIDEVRPALRAAEKHRQAARDELAAVVAPQEPWSAALLEKPPQHGLNVRRWDSALH